MQHAAAGSPDITSWEICQKSRNGEEMEILPSDNLTGRKSKTINSCGKTGNKLRNRLCTW